MRQRVCSVIKLHTSHEVTVTPMIGEQTTPGVNTVLHPRPHPRAFNRSVQSKGAIHICATRCAVFSRYTRHLCVSGTNESLLGK